MPTGEHRREHDVLVTRHEVSCDQLLLWKLTCDECFDGNPGGGGTGKGTKTNNLLFLLTAVDANRHFGDKGTCF